MRAALGVLLGLVARVWLATLRLRVVAHPSLAAHADVPWVLVFFHGTQWPLLAWRRRRRTVVLVSLSRDGAMQARALAVLGFDVVRGSSSRGGARGLAALVRRMRSGARDAAFAVDGPRGPYGVVKPGAALAARRTGAIVVPMGAACARATVLERAWDRYTLAWPFSRAAVVLGPPCAADDGAAVARAIASANDEARAILAGSARNMVALRRFSGAEPPSRRAVPSAVTKGI